MYALAFIHSGLDERGFTYNPLFPIHVIIYLCPHTHNTLATVYTGCFVARLISCQFNVVCVNSAGLMIVGAGGNFIQLHSLMHISIIN